MLKNLPSASTKCAQEKIVVFVMSFRDNKSEDNISGQSHEIWESQQREQECSPPRPGAESSPAVLSGVVGCFGKKSCFSGIP